MGPFQMGPFQNRCGYTFRFNENCQSSLKQDCYLCPDGSVYELEAFGTVPIHIEFPKVPFARDLTISLQRAAFVRLFGIVSFEMFWSFLETGPCLRSIKAGESTDFTKPVH